MDPQRTAFLAFAAAFLFFGFAELMQSFAWYVIAGSFVAAAIFAFGVARPVPARRIAYCGGALAVGLFLEAVFVPFAPGLYLFDMLLMIGALVALAIVGNEGRIAMVASACAIVATLGWVLMDFGIPVFIPGDVAAVLGSSYSLAANLQRGRVP
jgi:hypothetical protein